MGYDSPKLGISGSEVTMSYEPLIEENIVEFQQSHRLRNAGLRKYHRGDKEHFRLSFALMDETQKDNLYDVYKSHQELHFQPLPDSEPTVHYKVRWQGGFNIKYFRGLHIIGYEGVIDLDEV